MPEAAQVFAAGRAGGDVGEFWIRGEGRRPVIAAKGGNGLIGRSVHAAASELYSALAAPGRTLMSPWRTQTPQQFELIIAANSAAMSTKQWGEKKFPGGGLAAIADRRRPA